MSEIENHGEMPETTAEDQVSDQQEVTSTEPEGRENKVVAEEKKFTQEELEKAVQKRLARSKRQWERENQQTREPYDFVDQNIPVEAIELAKRISYEQDLRKNQENALAEYQKRADRFADQFDDFDDAVSDLMVTPDIAEVIRDHESGPEIAYYLAKNKSVADRISKLSPKQQVMELGKIHLQISTDPQLSAKVSKAPSPAPVIRKQGLDKPVYSTDDPRSVETMDVDEWLERERARQIKKLKGG